MTPLFERVALPDHEPVRHLLEQIAEALVVGAMFVAVLADQEEVVEGRSLEERRIEFAQREER